MVENAVIVNCCILQNPQREKNMRDLRGTDKSVRDRLESCPEWVPFIAAVAAAIRDNNPDTVVFFCIGGHHRSVALAEHFGKIIGVSPEHLCISAPTPLGNAPRRPRTVQEAITVITSSRSP